MHPNPRHPPLARPLAIAIVGRATVAIGCAGILGCGDVAALAEPPPEPTIWAEPGDPAAGVHMPGELRFAGGAVIGPRVFSPARVGPGESVRVQFSVAGLSAGRELWVGLRPPRAAARQEVAGQSRRLAGPVTDERDRWVQAITEGPADSAQVTAEIGVPAGWHAEHAVLLAEVRDGARTQVAIAGPRIDRGPAILGVLAIATRPTHMLAPRVQPGAVTIDGRIDEPAWARPAQLLVASLDGEPDPTATAVDLAALGDDALAPGRGTTLRLAWDDANLYVAASLPDADLWSDYTAQDDPLYRQEAFELFVAADADGERYLEYQWSARGVTFDARFPRYRAGDEAWDSSQRAAVMVAGTVDAPGDRDRGWSVEAAIPWAELCEQAALVCPPAPGMRLRINAFRLERPDRKRTDALALSPTRAPDFHAWANAAELELQ
jgi:hypothetical protein